MRMKTFGIDLFGKHYGYAGYNLDGAIEYADYLAKTQALYVCDRNPSIKIKYGRSVLAENIWEKDNDGFGEYWVAGKWKKKGVYEE